MNNRNVANRAGCVCVCVCVCLRLVFQLGFGNLSNTQIMDFDIELNLFGARFNV